MNRQSKITGFFVRAWILVIMFFLLTGCDNNTSSEVKEISRLPEKPAPEITIAAVGDSLTAGLGVDEDQAYPFLLEKRLVSEGYSCRVVNAGVSGETSSGTLSRIKWVISTLKPDIIILETGANDGMRGISTELLQANLDKIISIMQENKITIILAGMKMLPNLGPEYSSGFEKVYSEITKKHDIVSIPFFLEGIAGSDMYNQDDKIHPNPEGYKLLVKKIYPFVIEAIEKLKTD